MYMIKNLYPKYLKIVLTISKLMTSLQINQRPKQAPQQIRYAGENQHMRDAQHYMPLGNYQ